jgi:hypothetical protein
LRRAQIKIGASVFALESLSACACRPVDVAFREEEVE